MITLKWKNLLAGFVMVGGLVAFTGCDKDNDAVVTNNYQVSANATGAQVVPAVTGTGTATFTGNYNPNTRLLTYTATWSNLSSAPTYASFYSGASGVSGTVVGDPWALGGGLSTNGSFSGYAALTPEQEAEFLGGMWYFTLGTTTNPEAEVRGQINVTRDN